MPERNPHFFELYWVKIKNPKAPVVTREAEEDWGLPHWVRSKTARPSCEVPDLRNQIHAATLLRSAILNLVKVANATTEHVREDFIAARGNAHSWFLCSILGAYYDGNASIDSDGGLTLNARFC